MDRQPAVRTFHEILPEYLQIFHILGEGMGYDSTRHTKWANTADGRRKPGHTMFGYVRIYKPELKVGEYEQYQGVYCSLCKQLGKSCGQTSRLSLSYDLAFLALFRMALDDGCPRFERGRCFLHPLKKRACCCSNEHIRFAADVSALLVYYKLKDNMRDSGFLRRTALRAVQPPTALSRRRAAGRRPQLEEAVRAYIDDQSRLERERTPSLDAAAEPSARLLSYLASLTARDERERRILERFGYCLGRWIYLIDAVDDMAEDLRSGGYNPYLLSRGITAGEDAEQAIRETREYSRLTLNACLAECIAAYNLLEIRRFDGILRNVLEQGMPDAQERVIRGRLQKDKKVPAPYSPEEEDKQGIIAGKV